VAWLMTVKTTCCFFSVAHLLPIFCVRSSQH